MNKFSRNLISPIAAMVAIAVMATATPARADLAIFAQEAGVNSGNITLLASAADFTSVTYTGTYGDFTIKVLGGSSDNGSTLSDLLQSTTSVTNNDAANGHTLNLWVSQTNYTLPPGTPLYAEAGLGGSISLGTIGMTGIYQAYADKNNDLLAAGTLTGGPATTDFTTGSQNGVQTGSTFDTGSAFGIFNRTGDYSMSSVANLDISGGGKVNYSAHINMTPSPEPSTMALAGLGALGFVVYGLRRRKAMGA